LWAVMFVDDNPLIVTETIKSLICVCKYPPTIADIKNKINFIMQPEQPTEHEAWNSVRKAISDSIYNAEKHFDNLSEDVKKIIGSPNQLREWALTEDLNLEVVQSNFMRSYKAKMQYKQQIQALPESTKQLIEGLAEKLKMIGDDNG